MAASQLELIYGIKDLQGSCIIRYGKADSSTIACELDLNNGYLICKEIKSPDLDVFPYQPDDELYSIQELRLDTPFGEAIGSNIKPAFTQSPITIGKGQTVKFVINDPIDLKLSKEVSQHAYFFSPGIGSHSPFKITHEASFTGSSGITLYESALKHELISLRLAVSIASGDVVQLFAYATGNSLGLWLNHGKFRTVPAPLYFKHTQQQMRDIHQDAIKQLFVSTNDYLSKLNPKDLRMAETAIQSLLQARNAGLTYPVRLMAAYHFLEWFDGSGTINKNQLVERLSINDKEAERIVQCRNDLIHHNLWIGDAVRNAIEGYHCSKAKNFKKGLREVAADEHKVFFKTPNTEHAFANYLISICVHYFAKEISYTGPLGTYLPLT